MRPLGPAALPLSLLYALGTSLFRKGYASGFLGRTRFGFPVLSVGNIEAGGTGKTPLVLALCRRILARGKPPGIVSRGYGRIHPDRDLFVSRGEGPLVPPEESGDEPALYAARLPGVPVAVARDRRRGVSMLEGLCDVAILDDGFQSLEVIPPVSLVFLPAFLAERPARLSDLLPSGPLREPVTSLSRATHFVMTSSGDSDRDRERGARALENLSPALSPEALRPVLFQRFRIVEVKSFEGQRILLPGELAGQKVAVVAGIANPERVEADLRGLGAEVSGILALPDHAPDTREMRSRIGCFAEEMKAKGAAHLLATEKDRVKWTEPPTETLPLGILSGEAELCDEPRWETLLDELLGG